MGIKIRWVALFIGGILLASVLIFPTELRVANLLGRGGKYEEAISTYQKILAKNPNRYNLRKELGKIYLLNNEFEKALKEFETVSTVFSSDREVLKNLYQIYSYLGDKEKTITTLEKITKLSPEDMFYQIKLAEAYEWNNNIENAIEQYEKLLVKNSKDINSLNKLIHLNLRNRKYEKSIPYLKKLLELEPENIEARKLLSRVYIEMNHKEKAADELEKALSLEPDNEQLRVRLADLYLWIQRPERAILHYEYLVLHHKWNENYFNKLITLTENYDPNKAIKYYEYRFTFFPKDYKFRERFVNFYLHLGYTDEALQQIKILIENNPKEQKYLFQLARLYRDIREPKLANDVYELLFNKGFVEEEVMEALITYYQWEKEYDKLLTLYQKLLSKKLADLNIQRDYAEILILTQNYKEAIHQYSKLIKIEPRNVNYRLRLAELYYIIQEDKKAIEIIKQGLENYGIENEEYLLYAAQLFSELNYDNEGIVCYEKLIKKDKENRFYSLDLKFKLASLYWKQNNINKMNQTLEEINKSNKNEVSIHKKIAAFYFERGLFNKAIEYSQNLLISSPSDSSAMRMLGLAYAWNNQPEESKKILSEYHKIYKNDFYTHYQMGELYLLEGQRNRALQEFQKSLALSENLSETKESALVKAKIYAHTNAHAKAVAEFEKLISKYPDDLSIYNEYVESLLNMKNYVQATYWLNQALKRDPNNYRALRLKSRSYYEQGEYKKAAKVLKTLEKLYPNNLTLKLDLSDTELASGDWFNSIKSLEKVLQKDANNFAAKERLLQLRREQSPAISTDYRYEKQSGHFFKELYRFVYSLATSSIFNYTFSVNKKRYYSNYEGFDSEDETYLDFDINLTSRYNAKLLTSFGTQVQKNRNDWYLSGNGIVRWYFNPSNSFTISTSFNKTWDDPFIAPFFKGRLHNLESDINLSLAKRIYLWDHLTYERHYINNNIYFGEAFRNYFQLLYEWNKRPQFITYYQLYILNYNYQNRADKILISIPEHQSIHYLGGIFNQQLTGNFYYQLGTSVGYNTEDNSILYYGTIDLEYILMKRLRFRSHFIYGSQNRLSNDEDTKSLSFDLYYFY